MNKKELMEQLYIEDAILEQIMEKLFCVAIIQQGTVIASQILKRWEENDYTSSNYCL